MAGTVNPDVRTLEFIANGRNGMRAYETAVTLDTDGVTFNTALLLIGLDRSRARNAPKNHFDPAVAEGDPVDISIACPGHECQRMPAERFSVQHRDEAGTLGRELGVYRDRRSCPTAATSRRSTARWSASFTTLRRSSNTRAAPASTATGRSS